MLNLQSYLDQAPSSLLQRFYQRFAQKDGLVNNTIVREKVADWAAHGERIAQLTQNWSAQEVYWLQRLYFQGQKGISSEGMNKWVSSAERYKIMPWLDLCAWELLAARQKYGEIYFCPFVEMFESVLELNLNNANSEPNYDTELDYGSFFQIHLFRLLCALQESKIKLNQNDDFNLKSRKALVDTLSSRKEISLSAAESEFDLLFHILTKECPIYKQEGMLILDPNFEAEIIHLNEHYLSWVYRYLHTQGYDKAWLRSLCAFLNKKPWINQVPALFDQFQKVQDEIAFDSLPTLIQNLIFFGIIKIYKKNQKIVRLGLGHLGQEILGLESSQKTIMPLYCTPNFEIYLPAYPVQNTHYSLEALAVLEKEGEMCKYVLNKDRFMEALQKRSVNSILAPLIQSWQMPSVVSQTVHTWLHHSTSVQKQAVHFYQIQDTELLAKLAQLSEIKEWILGIDLNSGVAVKNTYLKPFESFLASFGFHVQSAQNLTGELWKKHPTLTPLTGAEFDYNHHEPKSAVELKLSESFVFGKHQRELDFVQKMRVLEYAILNDQSIEIMNPDREVIMVLLPIRIHKQTTPICVEGYIESQSEKITLEVAEIFSLRLLN